MVDRPAAGDAPGQPDAFGLQIWEVDFGVDVLVKPDDDGRAVAPQIEDGFAQWEALQTILVQGHVVMRVRTVVPKILHACNDIRASMSGVSPVMTE